MEVLLFRALTKAKVEPDAAAKVVEALEEHIDVAVGQANKALETKLDSGLRSLQASIDSLRWMLMVQSAMIASAVALGGALTAYVQFIK